MVYVQGNKRPSDPHGGRATVKQVVSEDKIKQRRVPSEKRKDMFWGQKQQEFLVWTVQKYD